MTSRNGIRDSIVQQLTLVVLTVTASPAVAAEDTCWYPSSPFLFRANSAAEDIRRWGVFTDPIAALDVVSAPTIERQNAIYQELHTDCWVEGTDYVEGGYPVADPRTWGRSFNRHSNNPVPSFGCGPWAGTLTVYADRIHPSFVDTSNVPDDVKALVQATCFRPAYTVRLSNDGDQPSGGRLGEIEPGRAVVLRATVYDSEGSSASNIEIELTAEVAANSGGHQHDGERQTTHSGRLSSPVGTVTHDGRVLSATTAADGLTFTFTAPAPAGKHTVRATCTDRACRQEGPNEVSVGIEGLQPLMESAVYRLVGSVPWHPNNHYLTLTAVARVTVLAALYQAKMPNHSVLHLNDASLEQGGVFDINQNWRSPHFQHCRGTAIDIRANGVDGALNITSAIDPMIFRVADIAAKTGAQANFEVPFVGGVLRWDLRHFHTALMGSEGLQCP